MGEQRRFEVCFRILQYWLAKRTSAVVLKFLILKWLSSKRTQV